MKADIRIDVSRSRASAVGTTHGVTAAELRRIRSQVRRAHKVLAADRIEKRYGFYDLYKKTGVFKSLQETAKRFLADGCENLVVLGIGGSALGTTALATALKPPYYNLLSARERKGRPRIFVMDNIDPVTFRRMMRMCPPEKTVYSVVSKSGSTAETATQMMIVIHAVQRRLGKAAVKDHVIVITNPRNVVDEYGRPVTSPLHDVADAYGLKEFAVPYKVGGRFSVFSPVGMFPAAMLGMDLDAMRAGCRAMDRLCSTPDLDKNPAYLRAAVQYLAYKKRKAKVMSVMMPYADSLRDVADWYRQLWAESLGKRLSLDRRQVYVGQTPIRALGVTDQHSQVQLYCEGPNDKVINVIEVERFDETVRIPPALKSIADFDYLGGKTMNDLMDCELHGTIDALTACQRPVSRIILPEVNAYTVAQLLYMFESETAMAGRLFNVNVFDQPGVDQGKINARACMAKKRVWRQNSESRDPRRKTRNRKP